MLGYHVSITGNDFLIPKENEGAALQVLKDLNSPENDQRKGSGRGGRVWYTWMPADYDEIVTSCAEVLEMLRFDVETDDEGTRITGFNARTGDEDIFLRALAPWVKSGSYLEWRAEDDSLWRQDFENGKMTTKTGIITWQ